MAPHSPGTDQIETLLTIGFVAAIVVVVAVNAALLLALRRRGGTRPRRPRGRVGQLRAGAVLGVFAAALLVLGIVFTERAREVPASGPAGLDTDGSGPLRIEATGQQWLWRYDYPNGAFSYYELVVPVDTAVELRLASTDVIHTWNVPDLAGKRDAVPGKLSTVTFRADEEGSYRGRAATLSGAAYAAMETEVEVVSADEYESFVAQLKDEIEAGQDAAAEHIEGDELR